MSNLGLKAVMCSILWALLPVNSNAQWRIGITGGASVNFHHVDYRYLDFSYSQEVGGFVGFVGQYSLTSRIGVKTGIGWIQKNFQCQQIWDGSSVLGFKSVNNYLQLPITIVYSPLRTKKISLDFDAGLYGACRFSSKISGDNIIYDDTLYDEYNRRWGYGLATGISIGYAINYNYYFQIGACYYLSMISSKKDYNSIENPIYDMTLLIQSTISYTF